MTPQGSTEYARLRNRARRLGVDLTRDRNGEMRYTIDRESGGYADLVAECRTLRDVREALRSVEDGR